MTNSTNNSSSQQLSQEDSHAKISRCQVEEKESLASGLDCGMKCSESSKMFSRNGRLLKMYPLRSLGLTLVLQNLSEVGYHAEWHCVPASAIGAPHQRDRIWIVAYPDSGFISCPRRSSLIQRYVLAKTERNEKADGFVFDDFGKLSEGTINNFKAEHWLHQSPRCRMVDGLPKRLDKNRLKQLGNSLVPQIPQLIGYAILEYEKDINK